MATEKQIAANRKNARRSTGPKSAAGKSNSSRNGLFTGLLARDFIVTAIENLADFESLLASLTAEFQPESAHEQLLICQLARQVWMARRAARIEATVTAHALDAAGRDLWGDQPPPTDPTVAANANAAIFAISTPHGQTGFFYDAWINGGTTWTRWQVTAPECPRLNPAFLEEERHNLTGIWFRQEYLCEFLQSEDWCLPGRPRRRRPHR